jgi:hypothetical protein
MAPNRDFVEACLRREFKEHSLDATSENFNQYVKWHAESLGTVEGSDAMTNFYSELFAALPDLIPEVKALPAEDKANCVSGVTLNVVGRTAA